MGLKVLALTCLKRFHHHLKGLLSGLSGDVSRRLISLGTFSLGRQAGCDVHISSETCGQSNGYFIDQTAMDQDKIWRNTRTKPRPAPRLSHLRPHTFRVRLVLPRPPIDWRSAPRDVPVQGTSLGRASRSPECALKDFVRFVAVRRYAAMVDKIEECY